MNLRQYRGDRKNEDFLDILYKYLTVYEGIHNIDDITTQHIEKFIVYWYPRVFLDYTEDDIRNIVRQSEKYMSRVHNGNMNNYKKEMNFRDLEEELVRIQQISTQISSIKSKINVPHIKGGNSIWNKTDKTEGKDGQIYPIVKDNPIRNLFLKDEVITLEIYKEWDVETYWKVINIGLIYSPRAIKNLLN